MRAALNAVPGVRKVDVAYEDNRVDVGYVPGRTNASTLVAALQKLGYKVWPVATEQRRVGQPLGSNAGRAQPTMR